MRALLVIYMLGLSACAFMERNPKSGYYNDFSPGESAMDIYQTKQKSVEDDAKEELGLLGRPLAPEERAAVESRVLLKRKESRIASKRDKKQYYGVRASLRTDRERLAFLSLPSYEARQRFINSRGLGNPDETVSPELAKTIESNDIALGMSQKSVMESWGDPDAVEVSGNPIFGNERWKYNRYISGNEGYEKEMRIVYFESGRVIGWERP